MWRILLVIVLFCPLFAVAQPGEDPQKIIERRIEFIGENLENSDLDLTVFMDDFYFFLENPINLNETNFEELSRLHLLSDVQISAIIAYKKKYGNFITLYELSSIAELDREVIDMILPFVKVEPPAAKSLRIKNVFKYGNHEVLTRYERVFETKAGYLDYPDSVLAENPNKQYLGSPDKFYFRYRNQYKDRVSWGITAEKDAGEEFFTGTQKQGFDYYSGHLFLRGVWKFSAIALGDYQINVGQGLTMWSGFALGKTPNVFGARRNAQVLRPYTSVNESLYLRGGAFSFSANHWQLTGFASYKGVDANINAADTLDGIFDDSFSSFQISGYHRTVGEIEDKNKVHEFITGGELAWAGDHFRIGLAGVFTHYDVPLNASFKPYTQYKFNSDQLFTGGLNYRLFWRKMSFFGEFSMSDNLKPATLNGLIWHADSRLDLMLIHRYYDREFQSIYASGFGESSDNTAEQGIYMGAQLRVNKKLTVSAYYDQFEFLWLKWLTDDYSSGRDIFLQMDFTLSRSAKFYIRFKNKLTERNSKTTNEGLHDQVDLQRTSLRFNYEQKITPQLAVQSRIEWVNFRYDGDISNGILLFQDVEYSFLKVPLKLYLRYAIFDSDNYDSRIYAYENDLLYLFSIPSYYYKGARTYIMARYEISKRIDLWIRYGLWMYQNVDDISSGLEQIEGQRKSDIKIQLKIRL
ncbi:MAG: helix-hairpin-helix domain-containing protein [Crocinitomicaceae bacterium]|nr:helix-hairpin-helix domain-containing protein [Crocinitomicaceae bacterium]MBK8924725.1 helix-hairpin-helix domain-containing protein [Crocinitomicaceae bacterium]